MSYNDQNNLKRRDFFGTIYFILTKQPMLSVCVCACVCVCVRACMCVRSTSRGARSVLNPTDVARDELMGDVRDAHVQEQLRDKQGKGKKKSCINLSL
jgi:hypothetical protein